ncbi:hypothetical protein B0T22DRAFT_447570 [Podospora appendiculata]|uniref:Zn(2)-C6 fungal-type domain-containing protein n=1 Tax=Podospora appendiculata TaxID=314037 RepID=A0AAE0XFS5_9PEZI|nr:hypothetical protein B0T22DRAFT_447570 [Podospora appendiculata]
MEYMAGGVAGAGEVAGDMANDNSDSPIFRATHSGRKGSKKVRTGCITCKIRKVKCDETKPYCVRCTKTGRRCDGYLDARTMAQRRRRSGAAMPGDSPGDPQAPLFYEWASAEEKRSFQFFQHVTAPCLSGDYDGAFWSGIVLQICRSEPAVKHAVLAVSSLHEGMTRGTVAPYADISDRQSFALWQYNKSIAFLLDQMRDADAKPLVPLLTCILFVCIEFMQSKDRESLIHLDQGRYILSQLGRKASSRNPEIDIIKDHLVPVYTRLSLTSLMFGGDPVAIPMSLKTSVEIPAMFTTIDQVRYALYDFMDETLRFAKRTHQAKFSTVSSAEMLAFEDEQDYLLRKLSKFNVAFSLYQSRAGKDSPPGSVALVQIHIYTTLIWVSTALASRETAFDDHVASFSAIVPLAASFMDSIAAPSLRDNPAARAPTSSPSPADTRRFSNMFTFEMHIIAPLYFVAVKCRHPLIRRSALDLLQRNPTRRENLWRANIMAAIAEDIIKLEERHLDADTRSRSATPPELTAPFTAGFTPDLWATSQDMLPLGSLSQPNLFSEPTTSGQMSSSGADAEDLDLSHVPIDPSLLMDTADVDSSVHSSTHSFNDARSIASSTTFDDMGKPTIYVGGGRQGGTPSMSADTPSSTPTPWRAQSQFTTPGIILEPPTPMEEDPTVLGLPSGFHARRTSGASPSVSGSGSASGSRSSCSSVDLTEQRVNAPFDVPEHFRVHEAIIGPDKEDGSWVMMFRKLNGLDREWDVQTDYVAVA